MNRCNIYVVFFFNLRLRDPRLERPHDRNVPIATDRDQRVRTDQHRHGLGVVHQAAHHQPKRPVLQHERRDERERHAEQHHHQIPDGQVRDEVVGDGSHARVGLHDEQHDRVADHGRHEDQHVQEVAGQLKVQAGPVAADALANDWMIHRMQ